MSRLQNPQWMGKHTYGKFRRQCSVVLIGCLVTYQGQLFLASGRKAMHAYPGSVLQGHHIVIFIIIIIVIMITIIIISIMLVYSNNKEDTTFHFNQRIRHCFSIYVLWFCRHSRARKAIELMARNVDVGQVSYERIACGRSNPSNLSQFDSRAYPLDRAEPSFGGARNYCRLRHATNR